MSDQPSQLDPVSELSNEIGASLASLRARFTGVRPVGTSVELDKDVVRWTLPELNETDVDMTETRQPLTETGYRRETDAAVGKAMGRRVRAKITKLNKKTGVTTETFVLDVVYEKN